jgi:hypothetical protein
MPFLYFFHNVTDMLIFVYDRESISHFLTSRKRFTRGRCQGVTLFKLQYLRRVIITHSRGGDFDVERGVNALFKIRLSLSLPSHLPAFVCFLGDWLYEFIARLASNAPRAHTIKHLHFCCYQILLHFKFTWFQAK